MFRYSVELTKVGGFHIPRLIVERVTFVRSSFNDASVILSSEYESCTRYFSSRSPGRVIAEYRFGFRRESVGKIV